MEDLEDCLNNCKEYLKKVSERDDSSKYKSSLASAKTLHKNSSIRHKEPCENLGDTYENLDRGAREADLGVPVVMKEDLYTPIFENIMQRLRFFKKLHLSVPTDLIAFCPGGSHTSRLRVAQVKEGQISMRY